MQAPIRAVGLIDVPVKIYQDVTSVINLRVKKLSLQLLDKIVKGRKVGWQIEELRVQPQDILAEQSVLGAIFYR